MNLKGTKSEQNILTAFAGESQARNKYNYYAEVARAEGQEETAQLFERMAENERAHAKIWLKFITEGKSSAEDGLIDAIRGESYEWNDMYRSFAEDARAEGLEALAVMFERVANIERSHEMQFLRELARLKSQSGAPAPEIAEKLEPEPKTGWRCRLCGNILEGDGEAPYSCPVCGALGVYERLR